MGHPSRSISALFVMDAVRTPFSSIRRIRTRVTSLNLTRCYCPEAVTFIQAATATRKFTPMFTV